MARQTLCLTPGDPMGVGPEITVKFLAEHRDRYPDCRFHVIGALKALEDAAHMLNLPLPQTDQVGYTHVPGALPGKVSAEALEQAVATIAEGKADALVTGPIHKQHLQEAGIPASGHTEILETLSHQYFPHVRAKAEMLFLYRRFRLMLLTRHIPLWAVSRALKAPQVSESLEILGDFLRQRLGIVRPQLAILGVNPHAGEIGGTEETEIFTPVMEAFNQTGRFHLEGPFAADAFFRGFDPECPAYDAVVAAYHDQGLIPFKLIAGYQAVNVTIGLPFLRTSVGHGTAMDIAGKGLAIEAGLIAAVDSAIALSSTVLTSP